MAGFGYVIAYIAAGRIFSWIIPSELQPGASKMWLLLPVVMWPICIVVCGTMYGAACLQARRRSVGG